MNKKRIPPISKAATAAIPVDSEAFKKLKISLAIIIVVFAFLLYVQSISFNYAYDDDTVIRQNSLTKNGLAAIPMILTHDRLYGSKDQSIRTPEYRPITSIAFALEWQLFPDSPQSYHLINVLLYALTCGLLFILLCKLFDKQNLVFPFICALLYAAHPIHTEVVDNIKSLDEILCFLFGILSIFFAVKYVHKKSILYMILSSINFFLAMLSKETGVTFLIVIPLILFIFKDYTLKKICIVFSILFSIFVVYFLIRIQVLKDVQWSITNSDLNNTLLDAPNYISRQATDFYILLKYILLLIFPNPLSYDYSYSQIKIQTLIESIVMLSLLIYFVIGIYAVYNLRKKSIVSFGILFFLITLSPVSNIFILIGATMAERFMYIPSFGYCIIITYFLIKIVKTENINKKIINLSLFFSANSTLFTIVFGIVFLYSIQTFSRSMDWKDNQTLFSHDVQISTNSVKAHYYLGDLILKELYPQETNDEKRKKYLEQAIEEFNKAISIRHNYFQAYLSLSLVYEQRKEYNKELIMADSVLKYASGNIDAYNNRGVALEGLGRFEESIISLNKGIALNPKYSLLYLNLGACYINMKENLKAIEILNKAIELDPNNAQCLYYISVAYNNVGDSLNSKQYLEKANRASTR